VAQASIVALLARCRLQGTAIGRAPELRLHVPHAPKHAVPHEWREEARRFRQKRDGRIRQRTTPELRPSTPEVEWSWVLDADTIPRPIHAGNEGPLDLTIRALSQRVQVTYLIRDDGAGFELDVWTPTETRWLMSRIRLDDLPIFSGRARTYLRCPACGTRVLKLYWPLEGGGGFGCRRCHQLAYRSSQERTVTLAQLRARVRRTRKPLPSLEALRRRQQRLLARATAMRAPRSGLPKRLPSSP
jgi:hypothetical protein